MAEPEMVQIRVEFLRNTTHLALAWALMDPRFPKVLDRGKCKDVDWVVVQVPRANSSNSIKELMKVVRVSKVYPYTPPPKPV